MQREPCGQSRLLNASEWTVGRYAGRDFCPADVLRAHGSEPGEADAGRPVSAGAILMAAIIARTRARTENDQSFQHLTLCPSRRGVSY